MPEVTGAAATTDRGAAGADPGRTFGLVLVYAKPDAGVPRVLVLTSAASLIGRDPPKGGWTIPQSAVSRVHAAFQRTKVGISIRDMNSRNGVFVNGVKKGESIVEEGDIVRIGDTLFKATGDAEAHRAFLDEPPGALPAGLVGGWAMARLARSTESVARGGATVLLMGETGVGKDVAARLVHAASGRTGRFVALNCAAIPANLVESQLFGHERGAFTGAVRSNEGLVRSSAGGTLFLDEIGDMPLEAQAKLLRVLESREVLPVGATQTLPVDVRVVCATHRDLPSLARGGSFRADLYARIAQRIIRIPPLRERKEDLEPLVSHFLEASGARRNSISFGFMLRLALYDWPFNVRELASAVQHAAELANGAELAAAHLPESVREPAPGDPDTARDAVRRRRKAPTADALRQLLELERGNVAAVARTLQRDPAQVFRWLRQFDIHPEDFR
jgi:DNA-binding NtrC family response regulator